MGDTIANVTDLYAIGTAHVLDNVGERIGTVSANWRSYLSSYGDVATLRDASGKPQAFIEITEKRKVVYYTVTPSGTKGEAFAETTYSQAGQQTKFSANLPDGIDPRIMISTPNLLYRWFGGKLGSLAI